jgi:hypothetical protein
MTKEKITNLPVNPTELLKQQLADANKRVGQSDARRVKLNIAGFTDPTGTVGAELEVVVADYTLIHSFFDKEYDADNLEPPICHANNRQFTELAPMEGSPQPQADMCVICPQNRFGSAPNGKAKACRNYRLLAITPTEAVAKSAMWTFSVAPTSTKRWDDYVRELMKLNLTPMFVKTKISFEVVKNSYAKPIFELIGPLDEGETTEIISRIEEAREILDLKPDWKEDEKSKAK